MKYLINHSPSPRTCQESTTIQTYTAVPPSNSTAPTSPPTSSIPYPPSTSVQPVNSPNHPIKHPSSSIPSSVAIV